jgi:CheY-like chemotaxis protein
MIDDAEQTVKTLLEELTRLQQSALNPTAATPGEPAEKAVAETMPRALIVEDNANEQKLLAGFLRLAGFEVVTANDGQQALDYLLSHEPPDVVLLDMLMPECDGPTAVTKIRKQAELAGLRIFAVSGTSPAQFGVETGPKGIDRWFHKPINPEELAREMAKDLVS